MSTILKRHVGRRFLTAWRRIIFPSRPRRLLFAFAPPADALPSALLRGHQLIEMIPAVRSDLECRAIALHQLNQIRGEWIFLTKSALYASHSESILRLRALGHRLIAAFGDLPVCAEVASLVDVLVASSVTQERFFRRCFSKIPTLHLTPHVDLRMPTITTPTDRARFGYFGMLNNCLHADDIADLVRIIDASNAADTSWMSRLYESNAHYAIRTALEQGVFKPFTKGFIAAHCGVPIVVASSDEEAIHYLGSTYPFAVDNLSLSSVREHICRFTNEYGSPSWIAARDAMRMVATRSSRSHIESELRNLLKVIW